MYNIFCQHLAMYASKHWFYAHLIWSDCRDSQTSLCFRPFWTSPRSPRSWKVNFWEKFLRHPARNFRILMVWIGNWLPKFEIINEKVMISELPFYPIWSHCQLILYSEGKIEIIRLARTKEYWAGFLVAMQLILRHLVLAIKKMMGGSGCFPYGTKWDSVPVRTPVRTPTERRFPDTVWQRQTLRLYNPSEGKNLWVYILKTYTYTYRPPSS